MGLRSETVLNWRFGREGAENAIYVAVIQNTGGDCASAYKLRFSSLQRPKVPTKVSVV